MEITYWAAFGLFIAGAAANLFMSSTGRNQESPSTPEKFEPLFLLKDNWKRIGLVLVLSFVFPVIAPETGYEMTKINVFGAGLFHDLVLERIKPYVKWLQTPRNPEQPLNPPLK